MDPTDCFFVPPERIARDSVEITGDELNHLIRVMRKKEGDGVRVVDGRGHGYDVTLTSITKKTAVGRITAHHDNLNESSLSVHLAVGVLKNPSKFDFLVEKVTELGVKRIIPLATERTIPKHAKPQRWQNIALAAMKQSGRSVLPQVDDMQSLRHVLTGVKTYDAAMVCHESAAAAPSLTKYLDSDVKRATMSILVLIGPEGGFSDEEIIACVESGCRVISLGARRLRTETAAIAAAALVLQRTER